MPRPPKHVMSLDGTLPLAASSSGQQIVRSGHPCPRVRAKKVDNSVRSSGSGIKLGARPAWSDYCHLGNFRVQSPRLASIINTDNPRRHLLCHKIPKGPTKFPKVIAHHDRRRFLSITAIIFRSSSGLMSPSICISSNSAANPVRLVSSLQVERLKPRVNLNPK